GLDDQGDVQVRQRIWRLSDGTEAAPARVVRQFIDERGNATGAVGSALDSRPATASGPGHRPRAGRPTPLPVRSAAVALGDDRWVVYGRRGLYTLDAPRPTRSSAEPGFWQRPLLPSARSTAVWPMPAPAAERGQALGPWLSSVFGDRALRRLFPEALPSELTDHRAAAVLTGIGLPALTGTAPPFVTTLALDETGLRPVTGPAAPQPHSAYLLGHWLSEPVVL
ncbi:hypothetical protein NGM37_23335, partial [Streptomyces sp. TRM76130]|nr:hypothetical protein [Streptomyces sp. TRM76130]